MLALINTMGMLFKRVAPVLLLSGGLLCLFLSAILSNPWVGISLPNELIMFLLLLGFNYTCARYFKMMPQLVQFLHPRKAHVFFGGLLLGVLPKGIASLSAAGGHVVWTSLQLPSAAALVSTLLIVSWEELWFRGIVLDYAAHHYTRLGAAAVFSVVFVLMHLLNPEIVLLEAAPDLFLGSMMLCLIYFIANSIWAPIGVHFANNFFENVCPLKITISMPVLVAVEGLIVLCLLWVLLHSTAPAELPEGSSEEKRA
jgi:membrane protease YdiL (CAAX protease family)